MWLCSLKSLWNSGNILACGFPEWTGALISQYMDAFLIPWQWTREHHEIVLRSSWPWGTESLYKDSCCPPKSSNFFFFFSSSIIWMFFFLIPTADKTLFEITDIITSHVFTANSKFQNTKMINWKWEQRCKVSLCSFFISSNMLCHSRAGLEPMSESSDAPCGHTDIFSESKLHPLTISSQNTPAEPFLYGLFSYTLTRTVQPSI